MKYKIIDLLKKHHKTLVLGAALGVIILYIMPIDQILAQTGGGGNSKNQGQGQDKVKDKDNNCENGLPPHRNGNDDNGNHLGCTGYKIVKKVK